MSSVLVCSISHQSPIKPVVARTTGLIFERSVVEKYIELNETCPITHTPLTLSDLTPISGKSSFDPEKSLLSKAVSATGVPTHHSQVPELLHRVKEDHDSLTLEIHALKQHVQKLRRELSHALYQKDASCRVIARLIQERDEARRVLGELESERVAHGGATATKGSNEAANVAPAPTSVLSELLMAQLEQKTKELNSDRKQRAKKNGFVEFFDHAKISQLERRVDLKVHTQGVIGIAEDAFTANYLFSIGKDKQLHAFNKPTNKIEASLTLSAKAREVLVWTSNASQDKEIDLIVTLESKSFAYIKYDQQARKFEQVAKHQFADAPHSLSVHPIGFLLFGLRGSTGWFIYDLQQQKTLYESGLDFPLRDLVNLSVHPDGHLLAFGTTNGRVHFWSLFDNEELTAFDTGFTTPNILSFSENGYYILVGEKNSSKLSIWDLRPKTNGLAKQFEFDHPVEDATFDKTGRCMLVASRGLHLIGTEGGKFATLSKFEAAEGQQPAVQLR